jgi:uncharacterized surface protein with fasciclin (FAS1) repeats
LDYVCKSLHWRRVLRGPNFHRTVSVRRCRRGRLPAGTVDTLLKPENKAALTKVLTYHVVPGRYTSSDLDKLIRKGNGTAMLKTASGGTLIFAKNGERNITVKDETGAVADISIYDVMQSNGVIFSVDRVLMPR